MSLASNRMAAVVFSCAALSATPVQAGDWEISVYGGVQGADSSRVKGNDPGGLGHFDFDSDWEGKSFHPPPYYGVRVTWWRNERLGFGLEFSHDKVYASDSTKTDQGFSVLEFTDGLNIVTANVLYRWPEPSRRWTPYVIGGLGVSVPHVEVTTAAGRTFEYEYGGLALRAAAGISYAFNEHWSGFAEVQATYTVNDVDLKNGGDLETNIFTNALNLGVSYRF
jgi:lipid A oxidase